MSAKTERRAVAKLEALYARLPTVACRGLCGAACGPLLLTALEAARMQKADARHRPLRVVGEARAARCVYLSPRGRCAVYAARPLICRVWGLVQRLSCMHGCVPDRWLSDREFLELAQALERLGPPLLMSTPAGLEALPPARGWSSIVAPAADPERVALEARLAEMTRGLRALHGGLVVGAQPSATDETHWIDLDDREKP